MVVAFNNRITAYADDNIGEYKGKYVCYKITFPDNSCYFGETNDIGRRITEHITHGQWKRFEKPLYFLMRHFGECHFSIMGSFDTKEDAVARETELIEQTREEILRSMGRERTYQTNDYKKTYLSERLHNLRK